MENTTLLTDAPVQAVADQDAGPVWVEAMPARTYKTPFYGDVPITPEKLQNFIKNFKEGVRGVDIALDFEHGEDPAKGKKAAGWYKDFKIAPSSDDPNVPALWGQVEFTEEAKSEIKDKQWRYHSLDWRDEWTDTDGNTYADVIFGGGLTNRPVAKNTLPINFSESMIQHLDDEGKKVIGESVLAALAEHKEMEHSEPGTGSPPEPRKDEDGSDDPAITEGWRRDTPPPEGTPQGKQEGGIAVGEYVFSEKSAHELLSVLELPGDAKADDVVTEARKLRGELDEIRKGQNATEQEKQFAEKYPDFWREHNQLMQRDRENAAKRFSESVKPVRKAEGLALKTLNEGLSTMALEKLEEIHVKFAEGSATLEDFEECIKTIMNGGIVRFGELGSGTDDDSIPDVNTDTPAGVATAKRLFSEVVAKIQREHPDMNPRQALAEATKKHPDLAQAYRVALPA